MQKPNDHDPLHQPIYHMHQSQQQTMSHQRQIGMAGPQMMVGFDVQVNQSNHDGWEVGPYKSDLFGCFEDIPSCLMAYCLPCVQYGQNYEALHKQDCLTQGLLFLVLMMFACPCIIHMGFRKQVRTKFNIPGDDCNDCLLTWCCQCCALAQDAREIEWRQMEAARRGMPF